jgi:hypothetical protein
MDDRAFDAAAKRIGAGNRRGFLKGLIGFGGLALAGGAIRGEADAARRGYAGPGVTKGNDCPAYCEDDDWLIIQQESGGTCAPYFRLSCEDGGLVCHDGVCHYPV